MQMQLLLQVFMVSEHFLILDDSATISSWGLLLRKYLLIFFSTIIKAVIFPLRMLCEFFGRYLSTFIETFLSPVSLCCWLLCAPVLLVTLCTCWIFCSELLSAALFLCVVGHFALFPCFSDSDLLSCCWIFCFKLLFALTLSISLDYYRNGYGLTWWCSWT